MMKPTELRIGNLVNTPDGVKKVRSIDKFGISYSLDEKHYKEVTFRSITPIELTEDRLVGFGCKIYRHGLGVDYILPKKKGTFTVRKRKGVLSHSITLTHTHQLQNLYYALTGEEL